MSRALIHLWSAPRCSSTALLTSFAQRKDCRGVDEPFYAAYLNAHPKIERPYRQQVLDSQADSHTWQTALESLRRLANTTKEPLTFAKHIAKQLPPSSEVQTDLWSDRHVVLFRDPSRVLASWARTLPDSVATLEAAFHESAFEQLETVLPYASAVIDQAELLREPERVLRAVCTRLDIPFDKAMLSWPVGPKPDLYGIWADTWYQDTFRSTGFERQRATAPLPIFDEGSVLEEARLVCEPIHAKLKRHSTRPAIVIPNPRNENIKIWVNGLKDRSEAKVSVFDSAVQNGDAVWEGLRVYKGMRIFALEEHLDRMFDSAQALGYREMPTRGEIMRAIVATLEANNMEDQVHIRLTLTRGVKVTSGMSPAVNQGPPTLIVLAEHKGFIDSAGKAQNKNSTTQLITSSVRRNSPNFGVDSKIHHCNMLNNILAKMEANFVGVDDALMLDDRGFIAETNATNIFIVERNGTVLTPFATACLHGITRGMVLSEVGPRTGIQVREADVSLTQAYSAAEVFTTGTMGELVAVTNIDGRTIGNGRVGPITRKLQAEYSRMVEEKAVDIRTRAKQID